MAVQRLIAALADTCRVAREDFGGSFGDVYAAFDRENRPKTLKTVERFEMGETWPRDPQATVSAYSALTGIPEAELWTTAIRDWQAAQAEAHDDQASGTEHGTEQSGGSGRKVAEQVGRESRARSQRRAK